MKIAAGFRSRASWCAFLIVLAVPSGAAMAQSVASNAVPRQEFATAKTVQTPADMAPEAPSVERTALADMDGEIASNAGRDTDENIDGTGLAESGAGTASTAFTQVTRYKPVRCDIDSVGRCVKDLLDDEVGMWTSPLRIHTRDLLWLLPLGAATAAALTTDSKAMATLGTYPNRIRFSKDFSDGMEYAAIGAPIGAYVLGKITHNETVRETGVLGIEAAIDSAVVVEVLKLATNRTRPNVTPYSGPFWPDDKFNTSGSFPSGHSTVVWAVAHVIADETPGNTWLHIGLYLLAAGTAVTRVTAQEHFPSDALVGSAIGYLIGGYVYRHHSEASGREGMPVMILPFSDAATRTTGLAITIDPASLHWKSPRELWSKLAGADSPFHATGN